MSLCYADLHGQSFPQECPARVPKKTVPQECHARLCHKSGLQECPTGVSHKRVPYTRVSHKTVTRVFYKQCPRRVPHNTVL